MTCIAAVVKEDGTIFMAGDKCGSNGFTKHSVSDPKVFLNGGFIIGYTTSFRMGQLLEYSWSQPTREEGISDRKYLQTKVITSIKNCLKDNDFGDDNKGGNFLLGYKGCLYEMQDDFSLLPRGTLGAVGSGSYHAEAVLKVLMDTGIPPEKCLEKAIDTAAYFVTSVSKEYDVVSLDNSK